MSEPLMSTMQDYPLGVPYLFRHGRAIHGDSEVVTWTEESHALATARAYPPGPVIEDEFADHSWTIIRQQWGKAAVRLARVLDDVLAEEVASAPD